MQRNEQIEAAYRIAKERYAALGVDTEEALRRLQDIQVSVHCWQGDDFHGCEAQGGELTGGIMATGNYRGRARNAEELRQDYEKAFALLPGKQRANLHAIYLETGGVPIERNAIEARHFEGWMQWADELGIALDFNTTAFSHPKADGYTLASRDPNIRDYWIEHGRRCRRIAAEMGRRQGNACMLNHWLPDGRKEFPVDSFERRKVFMESMDAMIQEKFDKQCMMDAIESKLFGLGMESFTVGSAEMCFGYALSRNIVLTYDLGHFHPTESVADKISSTLLYLDHIMLHTSRGVRWDSDHVVIQNDELSLLMKEVVRCNALDRVSIGLDFFDASINRIAAWVIGTRSTQKALLTALLEPIELLREMERDDVTARLALLEECKNMPGNAVWDYFCEKNEVPVGMEWFEEVKKYEETVLAERS
ncbi:L-rhamnose isomerase [Faecalicatena sp. AGMB00832]|uniref:L-rhamnose isomerase n=1 Tax=Faecalicatena faecalis TaxID=2726362 RepID=A0ABS6DAD2_9FIRM|nr:MULTISPECIES: L-rhamnose isomerase [Faecalicatena]MBU3878127.1 L-rhamnose isomerase [Faecalicatena faecalis]MCI6465228.1 L-rhamnose isomerase [Faecalicatena sp.]MDY5620867.1 L-rhamnose isomerase [Lachnospiraceae bacterium]